jgi:hypothetical protein
MNIISVTCRHCDTLNSVAICTRCQRSFVVTDAHLNGEVRGFIALSVQELPMDFSIKDCDFCAAKLRGALAVNAGLRQRTCPNCHREFLSAEDL